MKAPLQDPIWYAAYEAVRNLTDSKQDLAIRDYINYREAEIAELRKTINLYQKVLKEINSLSEI